MKKKYLTFGIMIFGVIHAGQLNAEGLTYTGATGTLFLPTASIAESGKLKYQFNTFGEEFYSDQYSKTYNHLVTIGIAPFLEIGGRLTEYYNPGAVQDNGITAGRRDLSANVKIRLPELGYGLPDFAIGANDIAGQAVHFRSQYIVGTKRFGKAAFSVGYAIGDNPEMNGEFGSIEYNPTENLSLMAEYVSDKYNIGASYDLQHLLKLPISVTAGRAFESEESDVVLAVTVSSPLSGQARNNRIADSTSLSFTDNQENLPAFVSKLTSYGLENVSLGETNTKELVVVYENKVYKHSYLDALALVAGAALEYVDHGRVVNVVILDNKLSKLAVRFPLVALKEYFTVNSPKAKQRFHERLRAWYPKQSFLSANRVSWIQGLAVRNRTWFDLMLQPKLTTAIGTEWSDGDYSAAVRADVDIPVWRGGSFHVAASAPVANSTLFDNGRVFAQSRQQGGLKEALVHQALKPTANSAVMASIGLMDVQNELYYTAQSETSIFSGNGNSRLYAKMAAFEPKDEDDGEGVTVAYASVRQAFPKYGVSAELGYGRFFEGDKGATLDLARNFGSADVSTYLKVLNKDEVEGGLRLTLPLSPRKAYKAGGFVVRGNEHWSYAQNTTLRDTKVSGGNPIRLNRMENPSPQRTLNGSFYDNSKLSPAHVKANIGRLREAYINLR